MTQSALLALSWLVASAALAQSDRQQVIDIPLTRPGEPVKLDIGILSARIEVIGEDRQDAQFEVGVTEGKRKIVTPSGTKPIKNAGYKFQVEERDNVISVGTDWRANKISLLARVPRRANLELATTNNGEIFVSNIIGNLQLNNVNGPITADNIVGTVIAESVNEDIKIGFREISGDNVMSMNSVNGDLVLGLPANAGVQLHIDNAKGEIYSDFEVDVVPTKPIVERSDGRRGIEVRVESVIVANINGGGPVIKMRTLNGNIQITKNSK